MRKILLRPGIHVFAISFMLAGSAIAQDKQHPVIDTKPFQDSANHWYGISDPHNEINARPGHPKYLATDLTDVGDNILLLQKDNGGWDKNYDIMAILTPDQKDSLKAAKNIIHTTYDNGTTYTQIACLAGIYDVTGIAKYKEGALKGLHFVLQSQYKNGGWPQFYPLEYKYSREITYNDGADEGVMQLLKDISDRVPKYNFVDDKLRAQLKVAYDKGLDCILKTQINDDGMPTAWCQQYNEVTLQPAWARKFEPPSICNGESSDIVLFLMSIDHPNQAMINAVQNAVAWFKQSEIMNTRIKTIAAPPLQTPYKISTHDRVVVNDQTAPPIWTRYYELKTHRPLFCNRDSKIVYSLAEVARERRDGYGWYTYAPQKVLDNYHAWQSKWAPNNDVLK